VKVFTLLGWRANGRDVDEMWFLRNSGLPEPSSPDGPGPEYSDGDEQPDQDLGEPFAIDAQREES